MLTHGKTQINKLSKCGNKGNFLNLKNIYQRLETSEAFSLKSRTRQKFLL